MCKRLRTGLDHFLTISPYCTPIFSLDMQRAIWGVVTTTPLILALSDVVVGADIIHNSERSDEISEVIVSRRWTGTLRPDDHIVFRSPLDPLRSHVGRIADIRSDVLVVPPSTSDNPRSGFVRHNQIVIRGLNLPPIAPALVLGKPLAVIWPPSHVRVFLQ